MLIQVGFKPIRKFDNYFIEAKKYIKKNFPKNPGEILQNPIYPSNHKSAKKRIRRNQKFELINKVRKSRVRTFIKKPIIPLTQIPKITINETQQTPPQDPILLIAISDGASVG